MLELKYLKQIIAEFDKLLQEFGGEVTGCTQEEVDEIELMLSFPYHLPGAYKEFLLYGGKKMAGMFKGGFSFSYNQAKFLIKNRDEEILYLLQCEDSEAKLPPDIYVLVEHLGAYFEYFRLIEGDDPPVYSWNEEDRGGLEVSKKVYDSFSNYLKDQIQRYKDYLVEQKRIFEEFGN